MTTFISIFGIVMLCIAGMIALGAVIMLSVALGRAIRFVFTHIFTFVFGVLGDLVRMVGAAVACVFFAVVAIGSVIIGRWAAANQYAEGVKREIVVFGCKGWSILVVRPLTFLFLDGLFEPFIKHGAHWNIKSEPPYPVSAVSQAKADFPGFEIVGSLPSGGSGAKLYIARPVGGNTARIASLPEQVVIKSFALAEGSTLPQIVRESRALEAARRLGLVLEHDLEAAKFWYAMPYHDGSHLGIMVRQLHAVETGNGLQTASLQDVLQFEVDLLETLSRYHHEGLWHKDVKPDNLIVEGNRAHLVDFGLVTSLGSAMTLTTHGTEYFRDPEMVRMALRGVKVHQVNGAKFDIYGAGAVLYFMLENTFPAHGGLSRFEKESPEVLRWIVRRAMTDYASRYETADEMLGDLKAAMASADIWSMKPAALPSMGGPAPGATVVSRRRSPAPPPPVDRGRPALRVRNWWTGSYESAGTVRPAAAAAPVAGAVSRRAGVPPRRVTAALCLLVLSAIGAIVGGVFIYSADRNNPVEQLRTMRVSDDEILARINLMLDESQGPGSFVHFESSSSSNSARSSSSSSGANSNASSNSSSSSREFRMSANADRQIKDFSGELASIVKQMEINARFSDQSPVVSEALLNKLQEAMKVFGPEHFQDAIRGVANAQSLQADQPGTIRIVVGGIPMLITPEQRELNMNLAKYPSASGSGRLVIVNDHPAKVNSEVDARLALEKSGLQAAGWQVIDDNPAAVARLTVALLQKGAGEGGPYDPVTIALKSLELDGVLWVTAGEGEESPVDRFQSRLLLAEPVDGVVSESAPQSDARNPDGLDRFRLAECRFDAGWLISRRKAA